MRILVKYNNSSYYWVDTITMHDEYDYACAILVSSKGVAFPICLDKIEVVDDNYHCEKQIQREIEGLKAEASDLKVQMALEKRLTELVNGR